MKNLKTLLNATGKFSGTGMLTVLFVMLLSVSLFAQTTDPGAETESLVGVFEVGVITFFVFLVTLFILFLGLHKVQNGEDSAVFVFFRKLNSALNDAKPVDQEKEIILDHDYDGIKELDNNLPPWWKALFYITIIFSVVYMLHFHILSPQIDQHYEYTEEMKQAEIAKAKASAGGTVTEKTVTKLTDAAALANGKTIFVKFCVACHGANAEGLVGPNLTDNYWIHGGDIKDLFRTVVNGVPEKGMLSWKNQLKPKEIQEVTSYILSLQGTNPANAKPPQGTLYAAPADSTAKADTTKPAAM